jgi:hypothetical protein
MFYVLFMCKCVLPPGVNPIAVDKYINTFTRKIQSALLYPECLKFMISYESLRFFFSAPTYAGLLREYNLSCYHLFFMKFIEMYAEDKSNVHVFKNLKLGFVQNMLYEK